MLHPEMLIKSTATSTQWSHTCIFDTTKSSQCDLCKIRTAMSYERDLLIPNLTMTVDNTSLWFLLAIMTVSLVSRCSGLITISTSHLIDPWLCLWLIIVRWFVPRKTLNQMMRDAVFVTAVSSRHIFAMLK